MKQFKFFTVFIILSLFISCCDKSSQNDDEINDQDSISIKKDTISGVIQKGPFINGSTISIAELDENLAPTGRKFDAQILDNSGFFSIKNIELESQYAELKADGFYFNEVKGEKSTSQITLYSISDLSDKETVNVNILSHLERSRIIFLIDEGKSFSEAKLQAKNEVLSIFKMDSEEMPDFTNLDITKDGDQNAILLAVSIILQGYRTPGELSELLANIITDIRTDGTLDSQSSKVSLINDIFRIDLASVRKNIETRYETLGISITIPDFEKYVKIFIDEFGTAPDIKITYPETGDHGKNILNENATTANCQEDLSMRAVIPEGMSLKVKIYGRCKNMNDYSFYFANYPDEGSGWKVYPNDIVEFSRTFESRHAGDIELGVKIMCSEIMIEFFENGATEPTNSKIFTGTGSICDDINSEENDEQNPDNELSDESATDNDSEENDEQPDSDM